MSNENQAKRTDRVLDLLTNPLTRYILSVLAGVNPGKFIGEIDSQIDIVADEEDESYAEV